MTLPFLIYPTTIEPFVEIEAPQNHSTPKLHNAVLFEIPSIIDEPYMEGLKLDPLAMMMELDDFQKEIENEKKEKKMNINN